LLCCLRAEIGAKRAKDGFLGTKSGLFIKVERQAQSDNGLRKVFPRLRSVIFTTKGCVVQEWYEFPVMLAR